MFKKYILFILILFFYFLLFKSDRVFAVTCSGSKSWSCPLVKCTWHTQLGYYSCDSDGAQSGTSSCTGPNSQGQCLYWGANHGSRCVMNNNNTSCYAERCIDINYGVCSGGGGATPTPGCTVICSPGATRCSGNTIQTCSSSGCSWVDGATCNNPPNQCQGGTCVQTQRKGCSGTTCTWVGINSNAGSCSSIGPNAPQCGGCNPNGSTCTGSGGQCCSGYCNSNGKCANPPPTNTPTPGGGGPSPTTGPTPAPTLPGGCHIPAPVYGCRSCSCTVVDRECGGGGTAPCLSSGDLGNACDNPPAPYPGRDTETLLIAVSLSASPSTVDGTTPVTLTAQVTRGPVGASQFDYAFFWDGCVGLISCATPDYSVRGGSTVSVQHTYPTVGDWHIPLVSVKPVTIAGLCRHFGESCGPAAGVCCSGLSCSISTGRCVFGSSSSEESATAHALVYVSCVAAPTPTPGGPTPTPSPQGAWTKLVNSSFVGLSALNNVIPSNVLRYDEDDPGGSYFIDSTTDSDRGGASSDPGEVTAPSINVGVGRNVSVKNWKKEGVSFTPQILVSSFISYIKSRKTYIDITGQDLKSGITADNKIYYIAGAQTISDDGTINKNKIVVIVDGDLTITHPKFNAPNRSVAILVKGDLILDPRVTELDGIFIVQGTIKTGTTVNQGLKVVGNLITQSALDNKRSQSNNRIPSVFVVFDPSYYRDLLSYLSIRTYDWKQLQ